MTKRSDIEVVSEAIFDAGLDMVRRGLEQNTADGVAHLIPENDDQLRWALEQTAKETPGWFTAIRKKIDEHGLDGPKGAHAAIAYVLGKAMAKSARLYAAREAKAAYVADRRSAPEHVKARLHQKIRRQEERLAQAITEVELAIEEYQDEPNAETKLALFTVLNKAAQRFRTAANNELLVARMQKKDSSDDE